MMGDGRTRSAGIVVLALLLGLIGATWWMLGHTERALEHATRAPRTGGVPAPGTDTVASPRRRVDPGGDEGARPADGEPGAPGPTVVSPVAHVITVVDPAGRPVAGAFLFSFTGEHVTGEGHTDTDGTAGWALGNDVLQMAVFARGWPVVVQTLAPGQDHRIELPRGAVVEGLVRVDGAPPTPDFELALRPSPPVTRYGDLPSHVRRHLRGSGLDPARMQAIVDELGRFRVAGLPDATTCVFVAARRYEPEDETSLRVTAPATGVVLAFRSLAAVRGRIVDASGRGTGKGRISVSFTDENGIHVESARQADDSGAFEVELGVRRAQDVMLRVTDADGNGSVETALGAVEPGLRELGDIALAPIPTIALHVVDLIGMPIAGAVATTTFGTRPIAWPTGADGLMQVPLADGETNLMVAALGYAAKPVRVPRGAADVVDVQLTASPVLDVTVLPTGGALPAGSMLRLRADPSPLAGEHGVAGVFVALGATPEDVRDEEGASQTAWFLLDEDGRALLAGLAAGRPIDIAVVDALGLEHATGNVTLTAAGRRALTLQVRTTAVTVTGIVTGAAGAPVANANLRATAPGADGGALHATTGADGRFEITGVAAPTLRFLIVAERHAMRTIESVPVRAGKDVEIALEPAQSVRLRVVDQDGNPVARALVSMRVAADDGTGNVTSRLARRIEDGLFELRDVPLREVDVSVRVAGTAHAFRIDGRVPESTFEVPADAD